MKVPLALAVSLVSASLSAAPSVQEVKDTIDRAATFYREKAAVNGGYVYYYSLDFSRRLGEGVAGPTEIWVQPPGTPTVGEAFLDAYEATGSRAHLDSAIAAGKALVHGQLESGAWQNSIDFNPAGPRAMLYRNGKGNPKGKNFSTLDDDISQSALRFMMRLDETLNFENETIHESVEYAATRLLQAQFPNGAFPQGWTGPVETRPLKESQYPDYDWRTEGRIKEYWDQYTLNDGIAGSMTDTLIRAHKIYKDSKYLSALRKLGEFLILSQMPDPQPAWAQQYGPDMQPIWARAFEPPAISGRESEDVMIALMKIAEYTGEDRFLEPIVPAVKYLESSLLPDGRMARYYELQNNKPLYMKREGRAYSLTNDDSNLPDHYGWKNPSRLDLIKQAYRAKLAGRDPLEILEPKAVDPDEVEEIVDDLDDEGRWVSEYDGELLVGQPKFQPGEKYLDSAVFAENMETLARWIGTD
ncbi:MAG: pectate lyase [Verrucomicrobiales bacterium]